MSPLESLRSQLKALIVETLDLKGVDPTSIGDDDPLFGEGLGLDSLDALELVVALEHRYGLPPNPDPDTGRRILASVNALAEYILAQGRTAD